MRLFSIALVTLGCGEVYDTSVLAVDRCDEATMQDGSAGRSFLLKHCTSCHSSHLVESSRYSAPLGVDLDTITGVRTHGDNVSSRVLDYSMPPSGGLPQQAIDEFVEWIDCGAPSHEEELPYGDWGEVGEAFELRVNVEYSQNGFDVVRYIESGTRGVLPAYPWSITNLYVTEDQAKLQSEEVFREDGSTLWSAYFLNGFSLANASENETSNIVTVTVHEAGTTVTEEWLIVSNLAAGEPIDSQEETQSPMVLSVDVEGGPRWEWHLDGTDSPAAYSFDLGTGPAWRSLRITSEFRSYGNALPLEVGQSWIERAVVTGGWSQ